MKNPAKQGNNEPDINSFVQEIQNMKIGFKKISPDKEEQDKSLKKEELVKKKSPKNDFAIDFSDDSDKSCNSEGIEVKVRSSPLISDTLLSTMKKKSPL